MNALYRVNDQGYMVKKLRHRAQVKPKYKMEDFENTTGEKFVQWIVQVRGYVVIQNATCWEELHAGLDAVGLRLVRKGSGAVIFVGGIAIKASSVDRNFVCSSCAKHSVSSSLASTSSGYSANSLLRRSSMSAGRTGGSIRRND